MTWRKLRCPRCEAEKKVRGWPRDPVMCDDHPRIEMWRVVQRWPSTSDAQPPLGTFWEDYEDA